MIAGSLEKYK